MVYNFFAKETSGSGIKMGNISNQRPLDLAARELAGELHNRIIRTFNERKGYSLFIDNIWGADLADMELWSKFNK